MINTYTYIKNRNSIKHLFTYILQSLEELWAGIVVATFTLYRLHYDACHRFARMFPLFK